MRSATHGINFSTRKAIRHVIEADFFFRTAVKNHFPPPTGRFPRTREPRSREKRYPFAQRTHATNDFSENSPIIHTEPRLSFPRLFRPFSRNSRARGWKLAGYAVACAEYPGVQSVVKSAGFVLTTHRHMHNDATSICVRAPTTAGYDATFPRIVEDEGRVAAENSRGGGGVAAECRRERVAGLSLGVALYGGMRTRRVAGGGREGEGWRRRRRRRLVPNSAH